MLASDVTLTHLKWENVLNVVFMIWKRLKLKVDELAVYCFRQTCLNSDKVYSSIVYFAHHSAFAVILS